MQQTIHQYWIVRVCSTLLSIVVLLFVFAWALMSGHILQCDE
jgi:hypothetical protein